MNDYWNLVSKEEIKSEHKKLLNFGLELLAKEDTDQLQLQKYNME